MLRSGLLNFAFELLVVGLVLNLKTHKVMIRMETVMMVMITMLGVGGMEFGKSTTCKGRCKV